MSAYREHPPPPALAALVACTWEREVGAARDQRVVPDACVDLMRMADGRLMIAGPDTGPHVQPLPAGGRVTGIRLRPGAAGAVLGVPAAELRDGRVPARELWGDTAAALEEALAELADPRPGLAVAVASRVARPDPLVAAAVRALDRPDARVAALAGELGISERQLRRRFDAAVGYGPKTLARILRFQRLLALPSGPLAERALDAGYADQAHMTAEVSRLAGVPPVRFLKDGGLAAP